MAWVTPPTFTALSGATAAMFNKLRDCLNAIGDTWDTYTPAWTGGTTNPTLGASTVAGRYRDTGKTADIQISITIGAGFVAGAGGYQFSLPPGMVPLNNGASECYGVGTARDASGPTARTFIVYCFSATQVAMLHTDGTGAVMTATTPWVPAAGDRISINIRGLEKV
jgi:hypothetical protein